MADKTSAAGAVDQASRSADHESSTTPQPEAPQSADAQDEHRRLPATVARSCLSWWAPFS